ncbi:hypothetical protein LV779_36065 [Streptomyces thinghirensis]|nr:hypothetical protein [Streptomyces thinghirensis]
MLTDVLSVDVAKALVTVDEWLSEYIRRPHGELGRTGPVCLVRRTPPSVPTRWRSASDWSAPPPSQTLIDEIVRCGLDEVQRGRLEVRQPETALAAARPAGPADRAPAPVGRGAHRAEAGECAAGLMIAQFHEKCEEKAARNPAFEVSHAPVPMMAVRSMAIHDVLFLADRREWFEEYASRFGAPLPQRVARHRPGADRGVRAGQGRLRPGS